MYLKTKKNHIFPFLPALMSHSSEEKPRLEKRRICIWRCQRAQRTISAGCASLSLSLCPSELLFHLSSGWWNETFSSKTHLHSIWFSPRTSFVHYVVVILVLTEKEKKPSLQRILNSLLTPQVYFSIAHRDDKSIIFSSALFRSLAIYSASPGLRHYEGGMKLKSLGIRYEGMCVVSLLCLVVNCPFNLNTPHPLLL